MSDLPVIVSGADADDEPTLGPHETLERLVHLDPERLRLALTDLTRGLGQVFRDVAEVGGYRLSTVQVSLEITAEGGVALIGTAKAGAKGAVNLTFTR